MDTFTDEAYHEAQRIVSSVISRCERSQLRFSEGSSHFSLLRNRLKSLYISRSILNHENIAEKYTKKELTEAIAPIASIINKCKKAISKFEQGTSQYSRFQSIINTMLILETLIKEESKSTGHS